MRKVRIEPLRQIDSEFDRITQSAFGALGAFDGLLRPLSTAMTMDAYRTGDELVAIIDLPGVAPESIDVTIEKNVVTINAERAFAAPQGARTITTERMQGKFSRRLVIDDGLDPERAQADYTDGVLTLRIPVTEQAQRHRIEVTAGSARKSIDSRDAAAEITHGEAGEETKTGASEGGT